MQSITQRNLASGRNKGAQKNKEEAEKIHNELRQMMKDFLKNKLNKTVDQAATYAWIRSGKILAKSTIKKIAKGIKKEVLKELSSSQ